LTTPADPEEKYISLLTGSQSGKSYQQLATQAATYLTQRLTNDNQVGVDTQATPDPGRSFLGSSETRQINFQAKMEDRLTFPFTQVEYRWEGWSITAQDMQKRVDDLKNKYDWTFYYPNFLGDAQKVQLYQLTLNINLYEEALRTLTEMKRENEAALVNSNFKKYVCRVSSSTHEPEANTTPCRAIVAFNRAYINYHKTSDLNKLSQYIVQMVDNLEQIVSFSEFVGLVGGKQNVYMYAVLSGYRQGTEVKSDPLLSREFGTKPALYADGIINYLEQRLGINDGEALGQFIRDYL